MYPVSLRDYQILGTDMNASEAYLDYRRGKKFRPKGHRIFIPSFPKSGSTYLSYIFYQIPEYKEVGLCLGTDRREQELAVVKLLDMHRFYDNFVVKHHVRYSGATHKLIEQFCLHPVLLVRNIFDSIVSFRDHSRVGGRVHQFAYMPEDLNDRDEEDILKFVARMIAPWFFNFFMSWTECEDKLTVTYEEINADVVAVVMKISDHYKLGLAEKGVRTAVFKAGDQPNRTRLNKAIVGRGNDLPDSVKKIVTDMAEYYRGYDLSLMGL